jgi:hypothetical protein
VPAGSTYEPITVTTRGLTAYASKQFVATFANSCTDFQPNSFALKSGFDVGTVIRRVEITRFKLLISTETVSLISPLRLLRLQAGSILLSQHKHSGNITFAPKIFYPAPASHQMAIGDLNGDGKPDLVTVSDSIQILINTSTPGNISFNMIPNFHRDYIGVSPSTISTETANQIWPQQLQ